jgi:tetratricopeptide (TPR) repeat protein
VANSLLLVLLGALCLAGQGGRESLETLLQRYQSDPRNGNLCEKIALTYTEANDFNKAAEFFRKAIQLEPQRIPPKKNLATVLWFGGNKAESEKLFRSLELQIPNDPVPHLYLGLAAYERGDLSRAASELDSAGTLASDNPEVFPILVEAYLSTGRAEAACNLLEARISAGQNTSQNYRWLGDSYARLQRPDRAYQAYSSAINRDASIPENYLALANFSIEHSNLAYARKVLQDGLQHIPNSPKLLLVSGLTWALGGNAEQSRKVFSEAQPADPKWSLPLLATGVIDLQEGRLAEAAAAFEKVQKVDPGDYRSYYLHAVTLSRLDGPDPANRKQIAAYLKRALTLNPNEPLVYIALAKANVASGNTAEAESQLKKALRLDSKNAVALYQLGLIYRRSGRTAEADRVMATFKQVKRTEEEGRVLLILKTLK